LERVRDLMDRAVDDALVSAYRRYERLFPRTDAKDRHVAAAAVAARRRAAVDTATIVTWNVKDFDGVEMEAVGLRVETPDASLCELLATAPATVIAAFERMRDNLRNPAKTTEECANTLATTG